MRICLDASVAVTGHQSKEPNHAVARTRVDRVFAGTDVLVVPAIFPVEVASALTRAGVDAKAVNDYLKAAGERTAANVRIGDLERERAIDYRMVAGADHAHVLVADLS